MRLVGWPLVAVSVDDALMADELEFAFTLMSVVDGMISETVVMRLIPFNFVLTVHNMVTMVSLAHMLTIVQVGIEELLIRGKGTDVLIVDAVTGVVAILVLAMRLMLWKVVTSLFVVSCFVMVLIRSCIVMSDGLAMVSQVVGNC